MKTIVNTCRVLAVISAMCFTSITNALPVIGVAVDNFTDQNNVGRIKHRSALGGDAIKYYIPLVNTDCTYGLDHCGTKSDRGNGGGVLSMNLMFTPVEMVASSLSVLFEDLDLKGANDPVGFFESVQVFNGSGVALTPIITDISSSYVTGDRDTQQLLSLNLGILTSNTYFATLKFKAEYNKRGKNTPEYLIASIDRIAVPAPSTLALLGLGLFGIGMAGKRNKNAWFLVTLNK